MAKSSWRFEFVDINKSIPTTESETKWIGYMVVRSPKGEVEAQYIPPYNEDRIKAMFGYPSADYPDLYEAIDFNNQGYGLYLSAPSANVDTHPNYYGGIYFTKRGILPIYRMSDKKKPNFEIGIEPGKEQLAIAEASSATTVDVMLDDPSKPNDQALIKFQGVPLSVINKCAYLDFDDWKSGKTFRYKIDKNNGLVVDPSTNVVCGTMELADDYNSYNIFLGGNGESGNILGGYQGTLNTLGDSKVPFIKLSNLKDIKDKSGNYRILIGTGEGAFAEFVASTTGGNLKTAIIKGGSIEVSDKNYKHTFKPLSSYFHFVYDIEEDVYAYIVQPSPTEQESTITLKDITYDKYIYKYKMKYVSSNNTSITEADLPAKTDPLFATLAGDNYSVLVVPAAGSIPGDNAGVWQYNFSQTEVEEEGQTVTKDIGWERSEDFEQASVLAYEPLNGEIDRNIHHSIYFIEDGYVEEMRTDRTSEPDYLLRENVWYNAFECGSSEVDHEGEIRTCGPFKGSLDEFGVDENGSDNYWEEIVPVDQSVIYAEVYVVRTFDEDLDDKGVFTGTRVDKYESTIKGQRYLSYLIDKQIQNGYTGCDSDIDQASEAYKGFAKCIGLGLAEAAKPKYEDTILFMETSGIDDVKSYFNAIRTNHKMATIISPKNINSTLFAKINKVKVVNPLRGSAQYCQEFQYKDKNLRKKYYSCPIGAIGAMLMRNDELCYGGAAPMWINDENLGVGGQIGDFMKRVPLKAKWDFEDPDTEILDIKGINPILMDVEDGVMITSHKTTEMYAGDWGFLGHSMAFDLCKREIRDTVMKPQIGKKINDYWIEKRQSQTDNILRKRTSGTNACWAWTKCDIAAVNTEYTKSQKIFNISVEVKPDPFAEKVRLTFTNVGATSIVSD